MKKESSKYRRQDEGSALTAPTSAAERHNAKQHEWLEQEESEFTAALGIVVSAFVDLGFGSAPAQQGRRAANDNHRLMALAAEFRRKSA